MTASLLQACLASAVTLALYSFYCFWEAGRADLAASFRHMVPGLPGIPKTGLPGAGYRSRGRRAATGALLLSLAAVASVAL